MSSSATTLRRDIGLAGWQAIYEQRAFWRNRARAFFAFLMPIMFLVIFASIFGKSTISTRDGLPYNDFFVPGILAYGIIATTFFNIAVSTAILRDQGVLKRMQGTPLPRWAYVAGRVGSAALTTLAMTALVLVIARLGYNVHVRGATFAGFFVALVLGSACFTTLGIGIVRYIRNADAAPAVLNFAILPLTFISGIWFTTDNQPASLRHIAEVFPVHALADALQFAFNPHTTGSGIEHSDVLNLAIWIVVGVVLMIRFLRQPLGEG
jgi:ABC-2 type transport system permease protein